MKKRSVFLPTAIIFLVISVILVTHLTISYLMDYERADNIITIGKVDLELSEGSFPESSIISTGGTLPKAPMITNNGINDEYVFLTVAVPKKKVTLLYENTTTGDPAHKEGEKVAGYPKEEKVEIFKIIANGANNSAISDNSPPEIVFGYNKGDSTAETPVAGWVYLENTFVPKGTKNASNYTFYSFGYNKKLIAGDDNKKSTITLFDEIRLKSFIDEELSNDYANAYSKGANVDIIVTAYGIQADDLGITDLPSDYSIISDENVGKIFTIVKNKQ